MSKSISVRDSTEKGEVVKEKWMAVQVAAWVNCLCFTLRRWSCGLSFCYSFNEASLTNTLNGTFLIISVEKWPKIRIWTDTIWNQSQLIPDIFHSFSLSSLHPSNRSRWSTRVLLPHTCAAHWGRWGARLCVGAQRPSGPPEPRTAVLMLQSVEWTTDTRSTSVTLWHHVGVSSSTNIQLVWNIMLFIHTHTDTRQPKFSNQPQQLNTAGPSTFNVHVVGVLWGAAEAGWRLRGGVTRFHTFVLQRIDTLMFASFSLMFSLYDPPAGRLPHWN